MQKRKIPTDVGKAKELKKLLVSANNNTERVRISVMVEYLRGKHMGKVSKGLGVSNQTVSTVVNLYLKKGEQEFYKTEFKGRIESDNHKTMKEEVEKYIRKQRGEGIQVDINDVRREMNKKMSKNYGYGTYWRLIRRRMGFNYQKPFITNEKQPTHAKEIAEGRLRKAIYNIALEEGEIDAECVKNKKTKFSETVL